MGLIIQKINATAYKLQLPDYFAIHDVFHISKLRPYKGSDPTQEHNSFPKFSVENQPVLTPLLLIDYRSVYRQNRIIPQLLVQWSNSIEEDTTWEDIASMRDLYLEDKVISDGGTHEAIKLNSQEIEVAFLKEASRRRRLTETTGNTVAEDAGAVTVVAIADAEKLRPSKIEFA